MKGRAEVRGHILSYPHRKLLQASVLVTNPWKEEVGRQARLHEQVTGTHGKLGGSGRRVGSRLFRAGHGG